MIELETATRKYGDKVAVDRLDLTVPPGELFAFLGPNGAGKTTTIKMLVGLLRPTSGTVRVCGYDMVTQTRDAVCGLGYVPDEPFLYDKLSGRELLRFVARMRGLDRKQTAGSIDRQTENFGLASFLDSLIETYSHGMKQRLAFASALVHDPAVLVVDEPMLGLDPKSVRLVKDLMRSLANAGTVIFLSTHTLSLVEEIADRIGIVNHGQLNFLGTLKELQQALSSHQMPLEHLFLKLTDDTSNGGEKTAQQAVEKCKRSLS
jgi:ABC-2 type transport system ATP-binding protein